MTLHIFNPEHDIALASGLSNFTAPHAGRQLRHDLGFLPALWAGEGDAVLVDDKERSLRSVRRRKALTHRFVEKRDLCHLDIGRIEPWGWNSALRAALMRAGVSERLLPTLPQLDTIRQLSHRRTAALLLPSLRFDGTVGEAFECTQDEEVEALVAQYGQVVMKAPWSSSGRGLRFLSVGRTPFAMQQRWFQHLVAQQGCVMVEPYYNKVYDFGMEFHSDGHGHIAYQGLSLFHTANGAYTGNVLATERAKRNRLCRYLPQTLLESVQQHICDGLSEIFKDKYQGPFGVDMMVCATPHGQGAFLLHPCVEINLRRTMGHVALALSPTVDDLSFAMRIDYSGTNYQLRIRRI